MAVRSFLLLFEIGLWKKILLNGICLLKPFRQTLADDTKAFSRRGHFETAVLKLNFFSKEHNKAFYYQVFFLKFLILSDRLSVIVE